MVLYANIVVFQVYNTKQVYVLFFNNENMYEDTVQFTKRGNG